MPLFLNFIFLYKIDTFVHHSFINILAEAPISVSSQLSAQWAELHGMPSRNTNSGLPYSKPARYQLSHAAPSHQLFLFGKYHNMCTLLMNRYMWLKQYEEWILKNINNFFYIWKLASMDWWDAVRWLRSAHETFIEIFGTLEEKEDMNKI